MAKKRLSEVIRHECCATLNDAVSAYGAFLNLTALGAAYPKVAEAVSDEADLRPTIGGAAGVLEKLARPFVDAEIARLQQSEDGDHDEAVSRLQTKVAQLEARLVKLEQPSAS